MHKLTHALFDHSIGLVSVTCWPILSNIKRQVIQKMLLSLFQFLFCSLFASYLLVLRKNIFLDITTLLQICCTMSKRRTVIMGHSFCTRLKADLTAGIDARMAPAFNIARKVDEVLFLGKGGKRLNDVEWIDLSRFHRIQSEHRDIIKLRNGDNDVIFRHRLWGLSRPSGVVSHNAL